MYPCSIILEKKTYVITLCCALGSFAGGPREPRAVGRGQKGHGGGGSGADDVTAASTNERTERAAADAALATAAGHAPFGASDAGAFDFHFFGFVFLRFDRFFFFSFFFFKVSSAPTTGGVKRKAPVNLRRSAASHLMDAKRHCRPSPSTQVVVVENR